MTVATFFLYIIGIINFVLVPTIMALAFLALVWGIYTSFIINAADKDKREKGKKFIMYGITGFVLMFTFWGVVRLLVDSGGFGGARRPDIPNALEGLGLPGAQNNQGDAGAGQTGSTLPGSGTRSGNSCEPPYAQGGGKQARTDSGATLACIDENANNCGLCTPGSCLVQFTSRTGANYECGTIIN